MMVLFKVSREDAGLNYIMAPVIWRVSHTQFLTNPYTTQGKPKSNLHASATGCSKKAVVDGTEKLPLQATSPCNVQLAEEKAFMLFNREICLARPPTRAAKISHLVKVVFIQRSKRTYWKLWVDWKVWAEYSRQHNLSRTQSLLYKQSFL